MSFSFKRFFICMGIQAPIALGASFARGLAVANSAKAVLMSLCDGFFLSGALMLFAAGLAWTFGEGVGDGLSYSVQRFFTRRGSGYEENRRESYADYKERKHAKKPHVLEMLLSAVPFLFVAAILLLQYSRIG